MSREKNLAKNTFIISLGTLLPKFASFITLPIVTAGLTKVEYGTFDLISTLATLFLPIVTLQLRTAAFRFLIDCRHDHEESKKIISNIIGFIIPSSILSLIILYFVLGSLDIISRMLIIAFYLFDIFLSTFQQIARGLSYNRIYSLSSLIHAFVNMLLIVTFISGLKSGLHGALVASAVSTLAGAIYIFFRLKLYEFIDFRLFNKATLALLLKYSWPMIPNSMSLWALSVSDRLVLSFFIGVEATAVYAVANKIPALLSSAQNTFVYAWQENASIAAKDEDASEYYTKIFSYISRLLAGVLGLIIGLAPAIFKLFVKGDYSEAYSQMPILFLAIYFSCISSFIGGIYVAKKKTINVGVTTIVAAVINLAIDFALVSFVGIYAASISTLVSYLFLTIYRMINVRIFQKMQYNFKEIIFACSGLLLMSLISSEAIDIKAFVNLLIGIIYAVILNVGFIKIIAVKLKHSIANRK